MQDASKTNWTIEVSEADFETEVIERSKTVPVVVDFWAAWCGPCRMLGPILEKVAKEDEGRWVLAKLDVDQNQGPAMRYQVSSIPAVKAFVDGQVVDAFIGVIPEAKIKTFLEGFTPDEADKILERGLHLEAADDLEGALKAYKKALVERPGHAGALLGIGRVLLNQGSYEAAVESFAKVPEGKVEYPTAQSLSARAKFRQDADLSGDEIAARRRIAKDPEDLDARLLLASALAAKEDYREALEGLLAVLPDLEDDPRIRARDAVLEIFKALGDSHSITREYLPRLGSALW
jgi:putative thioredoxin